MKQPIGKIRGVHRKVSLVCQRSECHKEYFLFTAQSKRSKYCSLSCKSHCIMTSALKEKLKIINKGRVAWNKGKEHLRGEKHPNWKGGISMKKDRCVDCSLEITRGSSRCHFCANKKKALRGSKSNFWQGGVSTENELQRKSSEYKRWRTSVFTRDNFTCQDCGARDYVEADHIKPFAFFPELRFDVNNGRTRCRECHKKTPTYGGGARKSCQTITK